MKICKLIHDFEAIPDARYTPLDAIRELWQYAQENDCYCRCNINGIDMLIFDGYTPEYFYNEYFLPKIKRKA